MRRRRLARKSFRQIEYPLKLASNRDGTYVIQDGAGIVIAENLTKQSAVDIVARYNALDPALAWLRIVLEQDVYVQDRAQVPRKYLRNRRLLLLQAEKFLQFFGESVAQLPLPDPNELEITIVPAATALQNMGLLPKKKG